MYSKGWKILKLIRLLGVCFLVTLVIGCTAKEQRPSLKSIGSSPEIVDKDIKPKSLEMESTEQEPIILTSKVKVTASRLNLRENSSMESQILGVLKKDDVLEILSQKGKWVKVKTETALSGWVSIRHIEPIDDLPVVKAKDENQSEKRSKQQTPVKQSESDKNIKKTKSYFVQLYNNVNSAIVAGDLETFEKLSIPPNLSAPKIEPEQFTVMKDFLTDMVPALSITEFKKFNADKNIAIFVLQTNLDDKKDLHLASYKFIKTSEGWKLSGKVDGETIPRKSGKEDKTAIEKELKDNPIFQLGTLSGGVVAAKSDLKKPRSETVSTNAHSKDGRDKPPMFKAVIDTSQVKKDYAKGYFEIDGEKVHLKHAYVEMREDSFDQDKKVLCVFLMDRAVSSDDWRKQIISLSYDGKLQYIEFKINQSKHIIGVVIESPLLKMGYVSSSEGHAFEAKTFGPSVVEGSTFTDTREFQGQKYSYRVEFRATLTEDPGEIEQKSP